VRHHGEFYQLEGYHLSQPSPQRTPLLFQAGSSARGSRFAGQHAECVFIGGNGVEAVRTQVEQVRASAVAAGRGPDAIKVFMGIGVIVAPTEAEARGKHAEYLRYASPEAGIAHFSSSTGIDLAALGLDEPILARKTNAIESVVKTFTGWTKRRLLEQHALGGRYPLVIGSPGQVAEQLIEWIDATGLDGFNLTRIVTPQSYADFIDLVIPELQQRGRYKTAYAEGALRHKLFGQGPRLPEDHPAATWRDPARLQSETSGYHNLHGLSANALSLL
jgi:alkanesulfonate monooxygenase SsuD/methylene tetrahydromethanopterin reductase-like flavin-dependent oxidoreductase (luciferase family)